MTAALGEKFKKEKAENKRLREALEAIAGSKPEVHDAGTRYPDDCRFYDCAGCMQMIEVAAKVLEEVTT